MYDHMIFAHMIFNQARAQPAVNACLVSYCSSNSVHVYVSVHTHNCVAKQIKTYVTSVTLVIFVTHVTFVIHVTFVTQVTSLTLLPLLLISVTFVTFVTHVTYVTSLTSVIIRKK